MLVMSVTLSKIFAPKRDGIRADWRGLRNEELYALCSSPSIAPGIKSRRMEWARLVACVGKWQVRSRFWWENLWEKDHLEDLGVGVRILRQIFNKQEGGADWTDLAQDRDTWRALVNVVMNLRFQYNARNFVTIWGTVSFWKRSLQYGLRQWPSHDEIMQVLGIAK